MLEVTPVLVTGFCRPVLLAELLQYLSEIIPMDKLYIAIDGPVHDNQAKNIEVSKCHAIALEFKAIGANYLGATTNLGCYKWNRDAISWFLKNEAAGIIIEDDIFPTKEFLYFASYQLKHQEHNYQIGSIAGANIVPSSLLSEKWKDIRLSNYSSSWGWATWADRWSNFVDFSEITTIDSVVKSHTKNWAERRYWRKIFKKTFESRIDSWAYRWLFTHWINNWKVIYPNTNLITYLGFGKGATHTIKNTGWEWNHIDRKKIEEFEYSNSKTPHLDNVADSWLTQKHFRVRRNYVRELFYSNKITHLLLLQFDRFRGNI